MQAILSRLGLAVLAGTLAVAGAPSTARAYDLFGNDLAGFLVQTPDQCNAACNSNGACVAWTWVRAGLKHPTSPACFLKSAASTPSLNATCQTNADCLSGFKRSDGWCGETPAREVAPGVLGQDVVLTCAAGTSCRPRVTQGPDQVCWLIIPPIIIIPYPCHGPDIQTTDFFCQAP